MNLTLAEKFRLIVAIASAVVSFQLDVLVGYPLPLSDLNRVEFAVVALIVIIVSIFVSSLSKSKPKKSKKSKR